jgi:hypothetical protein
VSGTTSTAPNTTTPELYSTIDGDLNNGNVKFYTTADNEGHFMIELNNVLYIADRNYVHQVEDIKGEQIYSSFALDIPKTQKITTLGKNGTDLLIGSKILNSVNKAGLYIWNGWSVSFTSTDDIEETGVNAFLDVDNFVLASIGSNGRLYLYKNGAFVLYKTIPGDYSPTKTCTVNPYATANLGGLPLFGVSNVEGNPTPEGIYSFGSRIAGYPFVLNMEFPISERDGTNFLMTGVSIGAMVVFGNNLYVSWKDDTGHYGVDKLDYATKLDGAYFETCLIAPDRNILSNFSKYISTYKSLPAGTDINISYKTNQDVEWTNLSCKTDTIRKIIYQELVLKASSLKIRVDFDATDNLAPEMEGLFILLQ